MLLTTKYDTSNLNTYEFLFKIMAAVGTDSKKKEILVINEALRLQMMPELSEIKAKYETPSSIEKAIKVNRSTTFLLTISICFH